MVKYTTIKLTKEFASAIKKNGKYRRETYEDILKRKLSKINSEYKEVFKF